MPIDDRTTNRSYKLPNAGNHLADDVVRLRDALAAIDADVYARYTKLEVDQLITNLINGSPSALNTLNELAAALGNDANFATTVANQLALKANASNVYSKAESDARYVQGQTQAEMVFTATAGQSVFTLSTAIINKPSALVTVDGVVQPTSEYSINMVGTQLTLSEGVPVGTVVRVLALGVSSAGAPADDTVTTEKLRNGAVTTEKLAANAVTEDKVGNGAIAGPKLANSAVTLEKLAAALQEMLLPPGAVQFFAGLNAPSGWLKANGATISRSSYPSLWSYAQSSGNLAASDAAKQAGQFGPGNGVTTFTLPDLRGEFMRGWDDSRGVDSGRALGSAQVHSTESHKHAMNIGWDIDGVYFEWDGLGNPPAGSDVRTATYGKTNYNIAASAPGRFGYTNTPSAQSGETRPRNVALLACIKY